VVPPGRRQVLVELTPGHDIKISADHDDQAVASMLRRELKSFQLTLPRCRSKQE
jgi:hypothetical protein